MRLLILVISLSLTACEPITKNMVEAIDLSSGWTFKNIDSTKCYSAHVPGTVHTDLHRNGLITDPFYGCNEIDLQWIERANWQYETQFIVDDKMLEFKHLTIVFEGIDTYAEVLINGKKRLTTNNMHRKWEIPCKELLQKGTNTLTLNFASAIDQIRKDSLALGHHLPGGQWAFARKAAYHFGWDWGPRFVTVGIYKPVYLKMWNEHHFNNFYLSTKKLTAKNAKIILGFESHSTKQEKAILKITNATNDSTFLKKTIWLDSKISQQQHSFQIENPKRWWPNGLGEPYVYDMKISIESSSDSRFEASLPLAVRTLKTKLQPDSIGQALYVELNGHKTYMKGANYIPAHAFLSEVTNEKYREIIETARNSNMNMLRVWGGGFYENDAFYELCLRNGILIWQDFMFACSMYPLRQCFSAKRKARG